MIKYNDLGGIKRLFLILLFVFLFLSVSSKSIFAVELGSSDDADTILENAVLHLESIYNGCSECDGKWCILYDQYKIMRDEPFKYYAFYYVPDGVELDVYIASSNNPFKFSTHYGLEKLYVDKLSTVSELSFTIDIRNNPYLSKVGNLLTKENFTGFFNGNVNHITRIIRSNHNIYDLKNNLIYKIKYDFKDVLYFLRFILYNIFIIAGVVLDFILSNELLIVYHSILILIFIIFLFKKIRG